MAEGETERVVREWSGGGRGAGARYGGACGA